MHWNNKHCSYVFAFHLNDSGFIPYLWTYTNVSNRDNTMYLPLTLMALVWSIISERLRTPLTKTKPQITAIAANELIFNHLYQWRSKTINYTTSS